MPDRGLIDRCRRLVRGIAAGVLAAAMLLATEPAKTQTLGTERMEFRAEARIGMGKLFLVWPGPTTGSLVQAGSAVQAQFSRPLDGDLAPAAATLSPWLDAARPAGRGDMLALALKPGVQARIEQPHPRLAIIVLAARAEKTEAASRPPAETKADRRASQQRSTVGRRTGNPAPRRSVPPDAAPSPPRGGDTPKPADLPHPAGSPEMPPAPAAGPPAMDLGTQVELLPIPKPQTAAFGNGPDAPAGGKPMANHKAADPAAIRAKPHKAAVVAAPAKEAASAASIAFDVRSDMAEISFAWPEPVPAAVFQRAGVLWVLFGAKAPAVRREALSDSRLAGWLAPTASEPSPPAQVLRFALRRPVQVSAARAGNAWRLRLTPEAADGRRTETAREESLARIVGNGALLAAGGEQAVEIEDPLSGDRLGVILSTASLARQTGARLVDLELLPSAQGLVWRALADDVAAADTEQGLVVTRPGGLRLSARTSPDEPRAPSHEAPVRPGTVVTLSAENGHGPSLPARAAPVAQPDEAAAKPQQLAAPIDALIARELPAHPIGLRPLGGSDAAGRRQARRQLAAAVAHLTGIPRAKMQLDLARHHLADGLAAEAQAVLATIDEAALALPTASGLRQSRDALAAAAGVLMGRIDPPPSALLASEFDDDPEFALWRAYAAARAGRRDPAATAGMQADDLLSEYPEPLRWRLGLQLAAAELEADRTDRALAIADLLRRLPLAPAASAELHLLEARMSARQHKPEDAEQALQAALAEGDQDARIAAAFALTKLQHEQGSLSGEEAVRAFDEQRARWRGHPQQVEMLRHLAGLAADAGQLEKALGIWQVALDRTDDRATAEAIGATMRERLIAALNGADGGADGGADAAKPSPIAALALDRSYRHLLRNDPRFAETRLMLAGRAAELGLFETAAALLDEGASAGAPAAMLDQARRQLAQARADDGDGAAALRLLAGTSHAASPDQRNLAALLRAQAALETGDPQAALTGLGDRSDADAARLRAEAHWQLAAWPEVEAAARARIAALDDAEPVEGEAADALVRLAVARTRLGEPQAAAEIAERYGKHLSGAPQALLGLLAASTPPSGSSARLPAAVGTLVAATRTQLDALPRLP